MYTTRVKHSNVFVIVYMLRINYGMHETGAIAQADNKSEILIINNLLSRRDAFNHHIPSIDDRVERERESRDIIHTETHIENILLPFGGI